MNSNDRNSHTMAKCVLVAGLVSGACLFFLGTELIGSKMKNK
jgi:hypothetical protein